VVHFVGAGPGAVDLITVRGQDLLREADRVIYAGSLVNPAFLELCKDGCICLNSATMTLEEVLDAIINAEREGLTTVRLHTGDTGLYSTIREQMDRLDALRIPYDVTPGVSSFSASAAAVHAEFTLPGVSQTLIITRMPGRTPVPDTEDMAALAKHRASMAVFLSASLLDRLTAKLLEGGLQADTPAAIVYKASWPDEKVIMCTVGTLEKAAREAGVSTTAMILIGAFLNGAGERSRLYDPSFSHMFREGTVAD